MSKTTYSVIQNFCYTEPLFHPLTLFQLHQSVRKISDFIAQHRPTMMCEAVGSSESHRLQSLSSDRTEAPEWHWHLDGT